MKTAYTAKYRNTIRYEFMEPYLKPHVLLPYIQLKDNDTPNTAITAENQQHSISFQFGRVLNSIHKFVQNIYLTSDPTSVYYKGWTQLMNSYKIFLMSDPTTVHYKVGHKS